MNKVNVSLVNSSKKKMAAMQISGMDFQQPMKMMVLDESTPSSRKSLAHLQIPQQQVDWKMSSQITQQEIDMIVSVSAEKCIGFI